MRAAVSGGMVVAIEQLGLTNVFDKIYASSGGAFNAVYLMTGQALYGSSIYADELTNTRFIDLKRLPTSKPVVSLDYAIDDVMSGTRAVDWEAAVDSPIELHPIASSLTARQAIDLGRPKSAEHLRRQLKATARVLVFGGAPDEIDGHRCVDASLYAGIPFDIAKEQGATHVFALLTRPAGVSRKPPSLLEKTVITWKLRQIERWLPEDSELRIEKYKQVVSDLEAATRDSSSLRGAGVRSADARGGAEPARARSHKGSRSGDRGHGGDVRAGRSQASDRFRASAVRLGRPAQETKRAETA